MEDKYFNEFFDKLYNGKLNIYEDEEEETSEEDVDKVEIKDDEINNDDNEQNSILDELKKRINKRSIESITKNVKFILNIDNYKSIGDSDNAKRFKERQLNGFWELYEIPNNKRYEPTWRKYIRIGNPNYDEGFKKSLKKFIENKDSGFEERLNELYIQSKLLKQTTIDSINLGIEKIRSVKNYTDLDDDSFKKRSLNGFWELYEIPNNESDEPNWRTYIRQEKPKYVKGFKEYIKTYIEDIYPEFKEKLEVLYNQYICDYGDIIPENPNYEISELKGILSKNLLIARAAAIASL